MSCYWRRFARTPGGITIALGAACGNRLAGRLSFIGAVRRHLVYVARNLIDRRLNPGRVVDILSRQDRRDHPVRISLNGQMSLCQDRRARATLLSAYLRHIYLDRIVHKTGEDRLGDFEVQGGAISSILIGLNTLRS